MKNVNDQRTNGAEDSEAKDHKEKIPLWLQGLNDNEDEDTSPTDVEKSSVDTWIKEISEEKQDSTTIPPEQSPETTKPEPATDTNPDWLLKLSEKTSKITPNDDQGVEQTFLKEEEILTDPPSPGDAPEESEIEQSQENKQAETIEEFSAPEGEFELTEPLDEVEITGSIDKSYSDEISQKEDLPLWLQEMIAEPQESSPYQEHQNEEAIQTDEPNPAADEPTEPLNILDEPLSKEELKHDDQKVVEDNAYAEYKLDQIEHENEIFQDFFPKMEDLDEDDNEVMPESAPSDWEPERIGFDNIDSDPNSPFSETQKTTIEGDTRPIDVVQETPDIEEIVMADLEEDSILKVDEIPLKQPEQASEELSEKLQAVRALLARGETDEAIQLLKAFEDKSSYYQDLQAWLLDAASVPNDPGIEFWEIFGDIALENQDYETAVNAFATAIQSLLTPREDLNEIG